MKPGRPSKTAEHNALFRALEARRPVGDRVIDDLLAGPLLSWPFRLVATGARWRAGRVAVTLFIDHQWPGVRPTVLARTRLIDETITEIVPSTPQMVILGAGLDTRAWRLPGLDNVALFEVDHPATQRRKQSLLRRRALDLRRVRFIPTDFNLGRLGGAMAEAGFDPTVPTLFLWEGTTNYLSPEAVDETLRWCARSTPGSQLVFTYINADVLADPDRYVGADRVFSTVRRANEPMTFGLAPDTLAEYLAERGLQLVSDEGAATFRERCFGAASHTMHGHEFYRVARACITPTPTRPSARDSVAPRP